MRKAPHKKVRRPAATPATQGNTWLLHEKALKELERGVTHLHKQNYADAQRHFEAIVSGFPEEKELLDRAQVYVRICRGLMERKPAGPRKPEDCYYLGVIKANEANYAEAVEYLDRALQASPEDEKIHYVMASTLALDGRREDALKHLKEAIDRNATNRVHARNDPDFEPIRDDDVFQSLVYPDEA
jgi:tetratricopeptide (TPR) repeat protein